MAEIRNLDRKLNVCGAELNLLDRAVAGFSISPAAGTTNVCNVTIRPVDASGAPLVRPGFLNVWLSDASTGFGLTSTTASGTVQAKSGYGTVINALVAKKALLVQTKETGEFVLEITDSGKTAFWVCVENPVNGKVTSRQLSASHYGS